MMKHLRDGGGLLISEPYPRRGNILCDFSDLLNFLNSSKYVLKKLFGLLNNVEEVGQEALAVGIDFCWARRANEDAGPLLLEWSRKEDPSIWLV